MKNLKSHIFEDTDFESYKIENIGVMKIKSNVYEIITDLNESSKFIQAMDTLERNPNIAALLILNEGNCLGDERYKSYLNTIFSHEENVVTSTNVELSNRKTRTRQLVILNSIIRKVIHSDKLVVNAMHGEIVTPFFGASLAAEIRLASEDVVFLLSHTKENIHPSGALPCFLPKQIGLAKASQILFCTDKLTVKEAFDLGLIHEILPIRNFEDQCIEKVKAIIARGNNTIKCTKRLLANYFEDVGKYLDTEECEFK